MTTPDADAPLRRELLAVLAHELRSPIGAILGWEELLSEGIHGTVDERARDALFRMRAAGRQLLQLVGGMSDLAQRDDDAFVDLETVDAHALLEDAVTALRPDAEARETRLELDAAPGLPDLRSDAERAGRALQLALGAAVKNTPGGTIRVRAGNDGGALRIEVCGARIDRERDDPDPLARRPSGAGLRIAMARRTLAPIGGSLTLHAAADADACTLVLRVPPAPD